MDHEINLAIEKVRDALFVEEEQEAFERIVDRLEGYEISYNLVVSENENLKEESE